MGATDQRRTMKRGFLALAGLAILLALPVSASGGSGDSVRAQRGDNFRISFTLKSRDGEPTAIRRFKFSKLTAECSGATIEVRGRIRLIDVHDNNRFSETVRRENKKVRVRGKVSNDLDTVRGTIRARGAFGQATSCDTGEVRWVARD
jgi:hypothetical protein